MNILVVGGAGYIGSHMVKYLLDREYRVTVMDNLSTGHDDAVLCEDLIVCDICDRAKLANIFSSYDFDVVMHFASFIEVGESIKNPGKYYGNNVIGTINLLDSMVNHEIRNFIFSSSAAIFGEPEAIPIREDHRKAPINPYGQTKLIIEQVLSDYDRAYGLKWAALRYFNAAGADPSGILGERHEPETHLIPLVLQAASNRRREVYIFGNNYDTPDGTCIRDYVHVVDLCQAHLQALEYITINGKSAAFNLGSGQGYSVRNVIDTASRISGMKINAVNAPRRPGDPARLVADPQLAKSELGWKPEFDDLEAIIGHAWMWEKKFSSTQKDNDS